MPFTCLRTISLKIVILPVILIFSWVQSQENEIIGFYLKDNRSKAVVEFQSVQNLMILSFTLNDKIPVNFILDTGVQHTIIFNKSVAELAGVKFLNRKIETFGLGYGYQTYATLAYGCKLSHDQIEGLNLSALVLEKDPFDLSEMIGIPVHGIIGSDFFRTFKVLIRYAEHRLYLYNDLPNVKKYSALKMELRNNKPYITTTEYNLLLDTGSSLGLSLIDQNNFKTSEPNVLGFIGQGINGPLYGVFQRKKKLQIGDYFLQNIIVNYPDSMSIPYLKFDTERDGSIGGEILSRFDILFDYNQDKIYFKTNSNIKKEFVFNNSGIFIRQVRHPEKQIIIKDIVENSSAANAGIQIGDRIRKINGQNLFQMKLNDVYQLLMKRDVNKRITLQIEREDKVLSKSFYLKKLL